MQMWKKDLEHTLGGDLRLNLSDNQLEEIGAFMDLKVRVNLIFPSTI